MIAVIMPEPAAWLDPVLARLLAGPGEPVVLFAPWALPRPLEGLLALLPGRVGSGAARRLVSAPSGVDVQVLPGWPVLELAGRLWSRGRTDRQMASRFALRRMTDHLAARWLPAGVRRVVAPSCAARRTFAAARRLGAETTLVQDLPLIRQMHEDLDQAARLHPACRFLVRYRAGHRIIVRQEAEWTLADRVLVRGRFAHQVLTGRAAGARVDLLAGPRVPTASPANVVRAPRRGPDWPAVILLAGLATARNGVMEALSLLQAAPGATLLVRPGAGMEPADLLRRQRVRAATPAERESLAGVDLVVAPALCEAYPPEVERAAALGVPVLATSRAAGCAPIDVALAAGDADGLRAAVAALRGG